VCGRNKPLARIVPYHLDGLVERERRLASHRVLALPLNKRRSSISWPTPPGMFPIRSWNRYGGKNEQARKHQLYQLVGLKKGLSVSERSGDAPCRILQAA
jgi:hypothetical protein